MTFQNQTNGKKLNLILLVLFVFVLMNLISNTGARASLLSTVQNTSSVSAGLGGAGVAAVTPGDVSTLNPSTLVHLRGYHFYSKYLPGESAFSISDNTPDSVIPAAAFIYQKEGYKEFKLTFAEQYSRGFSMGMSFNFYQLIIDSQTGDSATHLSQANGDLGFTYIANSNLGFATVFYDLAKGSTSWPEDKRIDPRWGIGAHYVYKGFLRWRLDYATGGNYSFQTGSWMTGAEDYLNRWTIIRVGFQKNTSEISDLMTLGLGFDLPKFRLNYAYLVETKDNSNLRHSVDLSVPF